MSAQAVGERLVALCQAGRNLEALDTLYSGNAESVEAVATEEFPAHTKGVAAIKQKNERWFAGNEIHSGSARGPFPHGDRFAVIFDFEVTPKAGPMAGQRMKMEEVGLYTVEGGKIVKEEFFYSMG